MSSTDGASRSTSAMTSPLSVDLHKAPKQDAVLSTIPALPATIDDEPRLPPNGAPVFEHIRDEPQVADAFDRKRSDSPSVSSRKREATECGMTADKGLCKMHRFTLYETATRFYLVGGDILDRRFRILKIDRTPDSSTLTMTEDDVVYTKKEMAQLLNTIEDGNKSTSFKERLTTWGLLGFIKLTGAYYMLLITKRSQKAMIGGHYVYQIEGTEWISLTTSQGSRFKADSRNAEETKYLGILNTLDLSRSFYYSYSYDITRTLQHNIHKERTALARPGPYVRAHDYNEMFVWNSYLLLPAATTLRNTYDWCQPIIHGYINQAALSIYGRIVHVTIIARRSRYFAGARFLKRGANDMGYVANDVETEQIVADGSTTSFHAPGPILYANPNFTSYVQHRGSIPLYWSQNNEGVTPKPPITLELVDPFYSAAALHFDDLFKRYGAPIYVLNLVKAKERSPRESKLLKEYSTAIDYLNQFLPDGKKIIHKAWDMSRAAKSREGDVMGTLEEIGEQIIQTTSFFRNGDGRTTLPKMQNGVARTNCIDCLDRTNAAQFVIGKRALAHQLCALGVIADTTIEYDTDAVNLFTEQFHEHGDAIAMQYGGSQLVNTMETYRKINQWTSHSRDMVESFKRYYNNSLFDGQRQEAYNLFLGNYVYVHGQPMLWELVSDYYLHHADPKAWSGLRRRSYVNWYTPSFLEERRLLPARREPGTVERSSGESCDDFWPEYYRPLALSSFLKIFSYKMNTSLRYIPAKVLDSPDHLSPFRVRTETDQVAHAKPVRVRKEVTVLDPHDDLADDDASIRSGMTTATTHTKRISLQSWLQPSHDRPQHLHGIMKDGSAEAHEARTKPKLTPLDKSKAAQWTFTQVVHESLNPSVTEEEEDDYARYVSHPQNLPLVISNETPATDIEAKYLEYVQGPWQQQQQESFGLDSRRGSEVDLSSFIDARGVSEEDLADYEGFLLVADEALSVMEEDTLKKRYKAYRKWLRGKSLFKQQPVD